MNRIAHILNKKGIKDLRPSEEILEGFGIKINTWIKWVDNSKDPELFQLPMIAEFLDCDVCDLIERPVPASHEK